MDKEIKPATTCEEQVHILESRNCIVGDVADCCKKLSELNYYRFTAYFLPFKMDDGSYAQGTSFLRVYRIYEFDRKLRSIMFTAVEGIEIYLRSQFAYFHAHKYGPTGYLDPANFSTHHNHSKFANKLTDEIKSNSKLLFVKHYVQEYGGLFPIWVAVELFTFGMLSYFYSDMPTSDQKVLAKSLYSTVPKNLSSWLRCCTDIRNICAHYGRLYYRIFSATPAGFTNEFSLSSIRRLWGAVLTVRILFPDSQKWNNEILSKMESLFEEYGDAIDLYHIAFPSNWAVILKK